MLDHLTQETNITEGLYNISQSTVGLVDQVKYKNKHFYITANLNKLNHIKPGKLRKTRFITLQVNIAATQICALNCSISTALNPKQVPVSPGHQIRPIYPTCSI